jgi:hypothetical protein
VSDAEYYVDLCDSGDDYGIFECIASYVDAGMNIECYDALYDCMY